MPLLIGPCMFLAPLVVVLVPLVIILWPPVLILLGIAWLVVSPFALMTLEGSALRGMRRWLGESFRTLLTPWTYFDKPNVAPTADSPDTPPA
jgi:hypothetical protein